MRVRGAVLGASLLAFIAAWGASPAPQLRPIELRDIVELTGIGSQPNPGGERGREQDIDVRSPDGALTAVVIRKGSIARNSNFYSLLIYRTAELLRKPQPAVLLRWESTSNRPAISHLKWLADNRTLAFLGERPGELSQVYTIGIDANAPVARTQAKTRVSGFVIAQDDSWLIYETEAPRDDPDIEYKRIHGFTVPPTAYLSDLLAGDWSGLPPEWSESRAPNLTVLRKNEASRTFRRPPRTMHFSMPDIFLDGRHAVFQLRQREERYVDLDLVTGGSREISAEEHDRLYPKVKDAVKNPRLTLEHRSDKPSQLVATGVLGRKRSVVLNTDAEIAPFRLTAVQALSGPLPNGKRWSAGLYMPLDAQPGKQYPLVIQTHGFDPGYFVPQGYSVGTAAQPLAARGIAVLQFDERSVIALSDFGTPAELPGAMAGYEAAIRHLDALGYIDITRIGVQGWSRTGQHLYYTLQNSKIPFAAAFISDAQTAGYFEKVVVQNVQYGYRDEGAELFGAQPQGEGLAQWAALSPGFNMHKLNVPIRLECYGVRNSAFMWEAYARLAELGKPVEFFILPDGAHSLVKPLERLASAEAMQDWFAFWLTGAKDPAVEKVEQYRRWEALAALRKR